jgi:hypothetical protein
MTLRLTALATLVVLFAGPTSIAHADNHGHGEGVSCESRNMGKTRCHVSWGDARLVQQTSDTQCIRGENWGLDRKGLWVDHGCAGRFVAVHSGGRDDDHLTYGDNQHGDRHAGGWQPEPGWDTRFNIACASQDFRYHFCAADLGGAGRVSVARQVSNSACVEGRNWGSNRAGVWVDQGCAAEFTVDRRWH